MQLKPGMYNVITGSTCGTIYEGDTIRVLDNGNVLCKDVLGWLRKEEVDKIEGVEVEEIYTYTIVANIGGVETEVRAPYEDWTEARKAAEVLFAEGARSVTARRNGKEYFKLERSA